MTCVCCGHPMPARFRRMHPDCWTEHHSDPTGTWPPGHPDHTADPNDT